MSEESPPPNPAAFDVWLDFVWHKLDISKLAEGEGDEIKSMYEVAWSNGYKECEQLLETVAGGLASELARVHGALFNLIVALYKTQLSPTQAALVSAADVELAASQKRFFANYGNSIGRAPPERN